MAAERAIEPDECYVLGEDADPERADLAIEVAWTRGAIDTLEVYRKLRIREVWIWRRGAIEVYALRGESYRPISQSDLLPGLDLARLVQFVEVRPMTRAITEFRAAVR